MIPEGGLQIYQRECNWVQALEGDIDTGHTVFLHLGGMAAEDAPEGTWARNALTHRAPRYEVVDTDSGVMYGASRPAGPEHDLLAHRQLPVPVLGDGADRRAGAGGARAGVGPDGRRAHAGADHRPAGRAARPRWAARRWGRWRRCPTQRLVRPLPRVANENNDYLIDRDKQKTDSYTGIDAIFLQDQMATESMGADLRPHPGAARHQRHHGDPHAQAPHRRRAGAARPATRCRPASTTPRSTPSARAASCCRAPRTGSRRPPSYGRAGPSTPTSPATCWEAYRRLSTAGRARWLHARPSGARARAGARPGRCASAALHEQRRRGRRARRASGAHARSRSAS